MYCRTDLPPESHVCKQTVLHVQYCAVLCKSFKPLLISLWKMRNLCHSFQECFLLHTDSSNVNKRCVLRQAASNSA